MSITLTLWPVRHWIACRVDNTVCDWTLRLGPVSVNYAKQGAA